MIAGHLARQKCEVDRAFRELLGHPRTIPSGTESLCSPEAPELRDYPAPPVPGKGYALCNGHLRDLFDELAHEPRPVAPSAIG